MIKKVSLLTILALFITSLPCLANISILAKNSGNEDRKVFIYHIPEKDEVEEDVSEPSTSQDIKNSNSENLDITTDDITADTTKPLQEDEDTILGQNIENVELENYQIQDMYQDVLQGYASFDEDEPDTITLDPSIEELYIIIKKPVGVKSQKYLANSLSSTSLHSKINAIEYSIAPISQVSATKLGGFSAGTTYNQFIDTAELEQSTGIFSRYDSKYFAISTTYSKTVNSTNNNYNDNFYIAPELKINQYFTLREVLSTDITKNRKKAEFVISINPFGAKDIDRLKFELGASSTFDDTNTLLKNQFKFSTKLKL